MPLYTAIRHERPWKDWVDPEYPFGKEYHNTKEHKNAPDAWFQWFEFNPYEIGCDELQCMFKPREHILTMVCEFFLCISLLNSYFSDWQPSWSFGRHFEEQASTERLPEQSMSLQMGYSICKSFSNYDAH
jgi:phospholipase A2